MRFIHALLEKSYEFDPEVRSPVNDTPYVSKGVVYTEPLGCTLSGSHNALKQSSPARGAWWFPQRAFMIADSSTFELPLESSLVEAPKQAWGATLEHMKQGFLVSFSRECRYAFGIKYCGFHSLFSNALARKRCGRDECS